MQLPLTFWDISVWLAITAITLLALSEMTSPHYGHTDMIINRKRLRNAGLTTGTLFLITVIIRIIGIIITQ